MDFASVYLLCDDSIGTSLYRLTLLAFPGFGVIMQQNGNVLGVVLAERNENRIYLMLPVRCLCGKGYNLQFGRFVYVINQLLNSRYSSPPHT